MPNICPPCGDDPCAFVYPPAKPKGCFTAKDLIGAEYSHFIFGPRDLPKFDPSDAGAWKAVDNEGEGTYRCLPITGSSTAPDTTEKKIGGCEVIDIRTGYSSIEFQYLQVSKDEWNDFWRPIQCCGNSIRIYPIINCECAESYIDAEGNACGIEGTISFNREVSGDDTDCYKITGTVKWKADCDPALFDVAGDL